MIIGIRAHDLIKNSTIENLISKTKELGINNLQLVFNKSFSDYPFNNKNAMEVANILHNNNINVAMLGAYFNPVHSNKEKVKNNVAYFKEHLKYASILNCKYVGTETGSYNDDSWTYNPKNQTEEGYQETIAIFKDLVETAKEYKTTILMEPAYGHVIYSVSQLKRSYDEINSEYLKVTIDLYNLLYKGNYKNYKEIFTNALETFKDNIKVIHLKDFKVVFGQMIQCGLGKGIIDFDFIIEQINKYCKDAYLIFEGVTGNDIPSSLNLIQTIIKNKGLN